MPSTSSTNSNTFGSLVDSAVGYINTIILILMAASLALFFWGIAVYIYKLSDSSGAHEKGRQLMLWGVVAFFVMFSVWGLVNLLASSIF